MPVLISFPDTVTSAAQFTDGVVRGDSASSATSQTETTSDACGVCPGGKMRKSPEEDFDAVLAWMISGRVPEQYTPAVNPAAETTLTSVSHVSDVAGKGNSSCVDQSTEQAGTAPLQTIASVPQSSLPQDVAELPEAAGREVLDEVGDTNQSTTRATVTNDSGSNIAILNGAATSIQFQTLRSNSNPKSADGTVSSLIEQVSFRPSGSSVSLASVSDAPESPEPLSQVTIDALERVGKSSELTISGASFPSLQDSASSIPTAPAMVFSSTTAQPKSRPSEFSLSESRFPEQRFQQTESSVTASAGVTGSEFGFSSIETTSPDVLTSSAGTVIPFSGFPDTSESAELIVESGTRRVVSHSPVSASDRSDSPNRPTSAYFRSTSSDVVRSQRLQPGVSNALPDPAVTISSEVRQPLSNQVSQAIMAQIERSGNHQSDSLTIRLDPPELGEMTIELSRTHEGLAVRVTAREAVTMDMLLVRGQEIESHLRGQQMNLKSLEFLRADMSGNQFSHGQQQNDGSRRSENAMNQIRRGSGSFRKSNADVGRFATPDSAYGLSFRA